MVALPCRSVLKLHSMRGNTVAAIWKRSTSPMIELPQLSECGWEEDSSIRWVIDIFPNDIEDNFLYNDFTEEEFVVGDEGESYDDY